MILSAVVLLALVIAIIWLNVWNYRRRQKMTPEQRAIEDEETKREMQIW